MVRTVLVVLAAALATLVAAYAVLSRGPWSFRAALRRDADAGLARRSPQPLVTEADLAALPPPVQRYLRVTGCVGQERIQAIAIELRGALRGGPDEPWMPMTATQWSFFDRPTRLLHITASRAGVPFEALHRMVAPSAVFTVKVASAFRVTHAEGPAMDRSEAVTFLNDMAIFAPATLLSPAVRWEPVDDRTARATFSAGGGPEIRAELRFDDAGFLTGFWSDDRARASKDGKSFEAARWSTPVSDYRAFGARRIAARGVAAWTPPGGASFDYASFEVVDVRFNPASR